MIALNLTVVLASVRDASELPPEFSTETPVDDAPILAAQLSKRGYSSTWPAEYPGRNVTLRAKGQFRSGAVDSS